MLQLKNASPFVPAIAVFPNKDAVDTLYVVVKATFTLHPRLALAVKPAPPVLTDEYWGDPESSSLKYASELHIGKPATDVVLVGKAWAPRGTPVPETAVMVSVAGRRKVVRVSGDRVWRSGGGFSAPEPFTSMPLVFERAFGGTHAVSEKGPVLAETRNPVGVGFLGKRARSEMTGKKLPNLEDPRGLLERAGDLSPPACFGFVAPSWSPRLSFAGTYDEAWEKKRAPYLPADFNPRFFNCATPELAFDKFLVGGEPVELLGVSQRGPLSFNLPRCRPRAEVHIAGATQQPPFNLETVLIEPEENRICLSWRAELGCDKKALKVELVTVQVDGLDDLPREAKA
jgi:hypothetical protein